MRVFIHGPDILPKSRLGPLHFALKSTPRGIEIHENSKNIKVAILDLFLHAQGTRSDLEGRRIWR